ncbi:MAG: hypothetical protein RR619_08765 [Raoultibacter sp.]
MADFSLTQQELDAAGVGQPQICPRYYDPKNVSKQAQEVIRRHVLGYTKKEIAGVTGLTEMAIANIIKSNFGISQARNLQAAANYNAVEAAKEIRDMVPSALRVVNEILEDSDAPSSVKLRAAQDLLDRAGHAAVKKVDVRSTSLSLTADQLEAIKAKAMQTLNVQTLPGGLECQM